MLQKCIGWASKPIQQPPTSKNGVQSDPKRNNKSTKARPSGAKERPRRPQVTPRAAKIRPFAPQDCRGDLLAWFGSVSAPFCSHFSTVLGSNLPDLFMFFQVISVTFLATIWKNWVGWGVGGGRKHTFQMHLHSHQIPARPNPMTGTVRHCFATWID